MKVELIGQLLGSFSLSLCDTPHSLNLDACFNRHPLPLVVNDDVAAAAAARKQQRPLAATEAARTSPVYNFSPSGAGVAAAASGASFEVMLTYRLPPDIVCKHCVLRWRYVTGRTWGRALNGTECLGCGPQEEFRACADVTIVSADLSRPTTSSQGFFFGRKLGIAAELPHEIAAEIAPPPTPPQPGVHGLNKDISLAAESSSSGADSFYSTVAESDGTVSLYRNIVDSIKKGTTSAVSSLTTTATTLASVTRTTATTTTVSTTTTTPTAGLVSIRTYADGSLATEGDSATNAIIRSEAKPVPIIPIPIRNLTFLDSAINMEESLRVEDLPSDKKSAAPAAVLNAAAVPTAATISADSAKVYSSAEDIQSTTGERELEKRIQVIYERSNSSPVGWGMFMSIPVTFVFFFVGFLLYHTKKEQSAAAAGKTTLSDTTANPAEHHQQHYCYPRIVSHGGSAPAIYQSVPYADPHDAADIKRTDDDGGGNAATSVNDYAVPDIVSTATMRHINSGSSPQPPSAPAADDDDKPLANYMTNNSLATWRSSSAVNAPSLVDLHSQDIASTAAVAAPTENGGNQGRDGGSGMFIRNAQRRKSGISRRWVSEDWENEESFFSSLASRLARKQSRPEVTEL